jgi:hypothetical protein
MVDPDRPPLRGIVEADETIVPFRTKNDPIVVPAGRSGVGKMLVAGAVEVDGGIPRRARLNIIASFGKTKIHAFLLGAVAPTTKLVTSPSGGQKGIPFGLDSVARLAALKRTGAFDVVENRTSRRSLVLDADQTVALSATYSNVTARLDWETVLAEIGRIARDVFVNRAVRNMTTSLYIARRARCLGSLFRQARSISPMR